MQRLVKTEVNQLLQLCTAHTVYFGLDKSGYSAIQSYSRGIDEGYRRHTTPTDLQNDKDQWKQKNRAS